VFKKVREVGLIAVTAGILFPIVLGTTPRLPPYNEYVIHGSIVRQLGGPKQNFVVSLVGRFALFGPDSAIDLQGIAIRSESPASKAVTDTSGMFFLDIQTEMKIDSLAVRVSAVDRSSYTGGMFATPVTGDDISVTYPAQVSGCRGCETVTPAVTDVVGHRYSFQNQSYVVPF
jgi:hypothetical protein